MLMQYAIAMRNVSIRTEPTPEPLRKRKGDVWDRRQESRLNICEAVRIKSVGRQWAYVLSDTSAGYALEEEFLFCSKGQYECYRMLCRKNCRVVLKAGRNELGQYLRTGAVLPEEKALEALEPSLGELMRERWQTEYRSRCCNGRYTWDTPPVLIQGYLPLSERQILLQMKRMLGIPYSWGDERVDGMDCSSTVRAFYACFGLHLPRNSGDQRRYGERLAETGMAEYTDLQGMDAASKKKVLQRMGAGTVLHMPGHVMLFAGEQDGISLIFHNCDTYTEENVEHVVRNCVMSEFLPKGEGTYLDYLTAAWKPR